MNYWLPFGVALGLGLALTPMVRRLAIRIGAVDQPVGGRKIHRHPTPRLGGVAMAAAFIISVLLFVHGSRHLVGLLLGAVVILVVGAIDDRRSISPWVKLGWQVVAAGLALAGGIGITALSSPFGGFVDLGQHAIAISLLGLHFHLAPLANLLSIIWIVGMINAVNFLDGLDGLATGVSSIASFFLFALAISLGQSEVAILAIALCGASLGFLPFNSYPAKIFLGDSGAYFLGLVLALLAIYSGGKLATAALVLGFTIIDGLLTVLRRLYKRSNPFTADRSHLHHLLLDSGLSQRQTALIYYALAILLGLLALSSGTLVKLVSILILTLATATLIAILIRVAKSKGSDLA